MKFKNINKKSSSKKYSSKTKKDTGLKTNNEKQKFPNIYRFITENSLVKRFISASNKINKKNKESTLFFAFYVFYNFFLICLIIFLFFSILKFQKEYREIVSKKIAIEKNIAYWKEMSLKYSEFRDIDLKIADLYYQIGDYQKAKIYLQKSLQEDPGYKDALDLEQILN